MITISFNGNSINEIAKEARQFADSILSVTTRDVDKEKGKVTPISSWEGYRPVGVGSPGNWYPVDDGREWDEEELKDWIKRFTEDGRKVVKVLAEGLVIDPRKEAKKLGLSGVEWAGVWTGPRKQSNQVRESRGLKSCPYGHSYEEPRRLWMHKDIATKVLEILEDGGE